ncbi:GGDEF domain-containing protein [Janthinobacterium sp. EB271-G4-7A]|uniref:GGDEF domain-containing protein n=1 Tax=Janthinobacterium sp. EB271-G4-7A TaxID=2775056 RepID=UPI001E479A7C|nr:sensor domain-containing diguanylate cyclase [Janthinobacterium sp. EB271-G4-7A]MCC7696629.1 sensor domain-containing diguanylate cyclase [Janthinobacterium sp. EB271-G4-7A]
MDAVKDATNKDAAGTLAAQPEVLSKHKRPVIVWASIAFFCMCAMLLGMTIWIVWSSREVRLRESSAATENMARALATQAYMELEVADVMLEDIVEHIRNEGNNDATGERLQSHLQQLSRNIVEIAGVFIFDSQGDWLATSSGAMQDGNNADRDYFTYHKTHAQLSSRISAPVRSKSSGQWILPVSRRVELADGSFAGVVLVTLGLASFERIYDSLNLGNTGTAFFALDDGTLIYRRPFQPNIIGMDISSGALLRAYREKGPVGTAMMTAKVDEIERLYSYRHLERFPVIVAAGLSKEDIFAEWQRLSMQIVLASLAAGAALIYLFRRLMRQIAVRDRIEASLRLATAELRHANADLAARASQDGLTGLANRRCFDETLAQELKRAQRSGHEVSLIMLDVDFFKKFNDQYGHVAGDGCLQAVAGAVARSVGRIEDLAARYGGEEFAVIMPGTNAAGALEVAEAIRSAVEALQIAHAASANGVVTVSLGAATLQPGQQRCTESSELIRQADALLYQSKNTGRNRVSGGGPAA